MNSQQTRIALGVIAIVLFAWLVSPLLFSVREAPQPPVRISLSFDASKAHAVTEEFVRKFPNRIFGSLESRQPTGYLQDCLSEMGYEISYSHFDGRIAGKNKTGRNVLAYKQGSIDEILAIVAHFDTARTTAQGAADNGSGVGVLLEMARIFAANPTRRSLLLIFSDGGVWGSLGARDIAENNPQRAKIVAVLTLDHVVPGDVSALCLQETGQLGGYTPSWLRQLARQAAEAQGMPVVQASAFPEHFERALLVSSADQGPFLKAGIPAINLGSLSTDPSRAKAIRHSLQDTIENLRTAGFEKYGRAAECTVRMLDDLQSIPEGSAGSLRLWDSLFLKPAAMPVLHAFSFLPVAFILYFYAKNHCGRLNSLGIGRELLVCLGTILPFLAVYFFIGLARALRRIPIYALYPATDKDPVLLNPAWNVLGIILAASLFLAAFFYIIGRYSVRDLPKPDFYVSKLVLLALMLIIVVPALLRNSYWATSFLLLPAWVWALVGPGRSRTDRLRNAVWVLLAGVPYYAALWIYSSRLDLGWNYIWYQVLALSSGLFPASGFMLGSAAVALGIRFLVIQTREMRPGKQAVTGPQ